MFTPWLSIGSFHKVKTDTILYAQESNLYTTPIEYKSKIKLHGTNGGIIITPNGTVIPQNRSKIISTNNDNYEFATWVHNTSTIWAKLAHLRNNYNIIVYGEWCGNNIQNNTAISNINKKIFAVFAIRQCLSHTDPFDTIFVEPEILEQILYHNDITPDNNVYVLPWHTKIRIDFWSNNLPKIINKINHMVKNVEFEDPWVKEQFNVSGTGEGLVFYPSNFSKLNGSMRTSLLQSYIFKAKGEKHQVIKTRQAVLNDPILANTLSKFIDLVATESRMYQAVSETVNEFDKKYTGPVTAWFTKDVRKDIEKGEIILPDKFEWKIISDMLTQRIKNWYISKTRDKK